MTAFACLSIASMALASCWPSPSHYRLTATVDIDGVKYSGSSVQKLTCHRAWGLAQSLDVNRCEVSGAAVAVNLGRRGYLFVLRDGWDLDPHTGKRYNFQMTTYVENLFKAAGVDPYSSQTKLPDSWQVDASHLPLMATFSDINNPASIKEVEPGDLSSTFGRGVHLDSLIVSKTSDEVTQGMNENILPWIHGVHGYFSGNGAKDYSNFSTVVDAAAF